MTGRRQIAGRARRLAATGVLGLLGTALPGLAATGPWSIENEARVRLISGWRAAPAGAGELDLGVEFELAPDWHVYWKNSGDAGYAPRIDFGTSATIRDARLLYPAPHRFDLPGGLVSFGYERSVIYPVAGEWLGSPDGAATIAGRIDYLVCASECVPYTADLELPLPAAGAEAGVNVEPLDAGRLAAARDQVPRAPESVAEAPAIRLVALASDAHGATLELRAENGNFLAASPELFFETHPFFALGRPELRIGASGIRYRIPIRALDETKPRPSQSEFAWTLTGLDGRNGKYALEGRSTVTFPTAVRIGRSAWIVAALLVASAVGFWFRTRRNSSRQPVLEV
ncbi:MAG: protein-disulfide reductase DsbD domain-containing protein [Thermoanaerobaculia bacterium]